MRTKEVLILTTRLRWLTLALATMGLGASLADYSSRNLLVLPDQPKAAFASVTEPTGTTYSAGYLTEAVPMNATVVRRARRLIASTNSQSSGVSIPRSVAALSGTVDTVIPGLGQSVPEIRSFMPLPVVPSTTTPGSFAGINGNSGNGTSPETPPPAVPEPPAWMLALAGVAVLAAFKYRTMLTSGHRGAGLA